MVVIPSDQAPEPDQGARRVRLELVLHPEVPVVGSVRTSDGCERDFTGWLDLLVALETALARAGPPRLGSSEGPPRPS